MTRPARSVLALAVAATLGLLIVATATGRAAAGPLVVWAVHHVNTAEGSEVRLRPGLGLVALWLVAAAALAGIHRRRDV